MGAPLHIPAATKKQCYHCGDDCSTGSVEFDGREFCCSGCQTVYSILKDGSLDDYYRIQENPGIRPPEANNLSDLLNNEQVLNRIIEYRDGERIRIKLQIPSIHCSSCIWLLENLNKLIPSVKASRVDFARKEISVTTNGELTATKEVVDWLYRLGYPPVVQAGPDQEPARKESRKLLVRIGITGFCFGNIMLMSFPEYLASGHTVEPLLDTVFQTLMILLTIPVMIFGAAGYYSSAFKSLRQRYLTVDVPIALGITALFIRSLYEILATGEAGYLDSLAGLLFFLLIGKWIQSRTYENLSFEKDFKSFFPLAVLTWKDDGYEARSVEDLREGDLIKLRSNETLPVDAELLDPAATLDYSFVTGESDSILKHQGDHLYAGGRLTEKGASFRVLKPVSQSYLAELWNAGTTATSNRNTRLLRIIDAVSHRFTLIVLLISFSGLIFWAIRSDIGFALEVFTSILIVACPCALALAAPFTYGNSDRILGRNGIFLKNSGLVEGLSMIRHVVLDKTGTMTLTSSQGVSFIGKPLGNEEKEGLYAILEQSIHPLSQRILSFIGKQSPPADIQNYQEIPGQGIEARLEGNALLLGSASFLRGHGIPIPDKAMTEHENHTRSFFSVNGDYKGYFLFSNEYRKGIFEMIESLKNKKEISIVSGDSSQEQGFLRSRTGDLYMAFNQSPGDKEAYIRDIKHRSGGPVMMVGDGINDTAALEASDIGIAVVEDTSSFSPSSDIIMKADMTGSISDLLAYSGDAVRILKASLLVSVLYNITGVTIAYCGLLSPFIAAVLMPLSSVSVVGLVTVLTLLYARKRNFRV